MADIQPNTPPTSPGKTYKAVLTNNDTLAKDDNTLVSATDLKSSPPKAAPIENMWSDPDKLSRLASEMEILENVKMTKNVYPENVIIKAVADVLGKVGWNDYDKFSTTVNKIVNGPPYTVPFSTKTKNKRTGKFDFWIMRTYITIGPDVTYDVDNQKYPKKDVLMSRQFSDSLKDYCRNQLNDEVQFWVFTGASNGKQRLDMSRLHTGEIARLRSMGETNPNNLVMVQFKKKSPEIFIGESSE
jgi:hypothetical protein